MFAVYPPNNASSSSLSRTSLMKSGVMRTVHSLGALASTQPVRQLTAFLRLIDHMCTCPWSNIPFDVNYQMLMRLTASHLQLIAPGAPQTLCNIINPRESFEGVQNICWITNRQQGKTSTLARFLAALAVACPLGGLLFTVYSTSLDRSVELIKSAKKYVYWLSTDAGAHPDFRFTITRDNERLFAVKVGSAVNECIARPKNPESCRGDAPRAAIFDEVAFIGKKLWTEFAFPLLQVKGRVFTLATTPPAPSSWFAQFVALIQKRNAENDFFFKLINHSLACQPCIEAGSAVDCCHNLTFIPPWKSLVTMNQMLMLASDKEAYQMEVYGILAAGGQEYLPATLVDAAVERPAVQHDGTETEYVWVSLDPPSHGVSDFAGVAFVVNAQGVHVIVGLFNSNVKRCQTTEVQHIVHQFLRRLRAHPMIAASTILVPIIECNNNEILSMSLLRVFEQYGQVTIPWTEDNFDICISHGIGVWMTHENKMASIQSMYQALIDGRVVFAADMAVADKTAFIPNAPPATPGVLKQMWAAQLKAMQDQPDGTVSGKHVGNDDLATATMQGVYWSLCARAAFARY